MPGILSSFRKIVAPLALSMCLAPTAQAEEVSEARAAMLNLLESIEQLQAQMLSPQFGVTTADQVAEGQRAIAHVLETALFFWLEADPDRPAFKPYVTPTRKLLGDNPDSLYYFAPIRDDARYRITGNIGAATFTSITIERGSNDGHAARGTISSISDNEMEIAPDGSYEIILSRKKPKSGNWLKLEKGASQVTTRHYHQAKLSVAADPNFHIDLHIEALDPPANKPYEGDAQVARNLNAVANFVREHSMMALMPPNEEITGPLTWYSLEPNTFGPPGQWVSASDDIAYGNTHAWYSAGSYRLAADEALVIESVMPRTRFFNIVLWNHHMQSYDFANRQVSINGEQIKLEEDGSFRIVIAHEDPGVPNWLDTEGRESGVVYWRYVFPVGTPAPSTTRVVKLADLKK